MMRQMPWRHAVGALPSTAATSAPTMTRALATGFAKARGKRIRRGGGIPGPRFTGKISSEMTHRGESILESIRTPQTVVNPIGRWRILRGDLVQVTSGPLFGQRGHVLEVVRASNRVVVQGVGMVTKMVPQIGTERKKPVRTEGPIYVSRVNVVCPKTDKPTRIRYAYLEDGTKIRVSARSGAIIPRPEILKVRRQPKPKDTAKDTAATVVLERTYKDEDGLYEELQGFESVVQVFLPADSAPAQT